MSATDHSTETAERLAEQAESAAANDAAGAAALARQALIADPANARAANVLGVLAHARGRLVEAQMLLEQACSEPAADDDMRANLAAVRRELGRIYVAAAAEAAPVEPVPRMIDAFTREPLGYHPSSTRLGQALAAGRDPTAVARLAEIPSATTPGERNFLRQFTAELWNGQGDVFENGPLLGGTTRALALGMLANPARDPAARLHTYDWFNSKVPLDVPPEAFDQLVARGLLHPIARAEMDRTGSFKPVFDDLHSGHDYSPLLTSHTGALPGSPEDAQGAMPDLFTPEPGSTWRLLLVDGAKSWYGTRYFMHLTADRIPAGSHMLFQDYGWYTCFWLTALVGFFPDRFKLIAHIDTTYAFELTRAIEPSEVLERFPERPHDLGVEGLEELYGGLLRQAAPLGDPQLHMALTLHHAGALAYIGEKDRARALIDTLATEPFSPEQRDVIRRARIAPTYTPDGPVEL